MKEWKTLAKPVSSANNTNLIVAVAGAGRGPLVTRVLRAAASTGTAIQLWALEKNQNAYVYLLRQNELQWNGQVTVVKTDMRGWPGPDPSRNAKVDILVTELLGSFGDNELSPECLDGIQRHVARPHGISIPESYTAHLSPIATPRIHADLSGKVLLDKNAFETPWVTRLFQLDFVAAEKVPGHPRFQQAWEFVHPVEVSEADRFLAEHGASVRYATQGTGSMAGSSGTNEHNARHCHLTFVCRTRGVVHGLAGYFESVLYRPREARREKVEISILPDQIDRKSRDMISWFPIFFPIKVCFYGATLPPFKAGDTDLHHSNRFTFPRTRSWRSACGARRTIPRCGMSGLSRRMPGRGRRRGSRWARRICTVVGRLGVVCEGGCGVYTMMEDGRDMWTGKRDGVEKGGAGGQKRRA
jgi:protein arginine N-methyltransferase 5